MKRLIIFLFIVILMITIASIVATVNATGGSQTYTDIGGSAGTFIYSGTGYTEVAANGIGSTKGNYNTEAYNRKILTLGYSEVDINDSSNNQFRNTLDSSDQVEFSDAALVADTYVMTDNKDVTGDPLYAQLTDNATPSYQSVEIGFVQMGSGGGRYKSAGIIDDANLTASMRAQGAQGGVTATKDVTTGAGLKAGSNDMHFLKEERASASWIDKNGTGYDAKFDFVWEDYSVPLRVIPNNSTETESFNESANESINLALTY